MKLALPDALLSSIGNRGENHGDEVVTAHTVKLSADCPREILEEFREGLTKRYFDKEGIPLVPEIGSVAWKTEYENATMKVASLVFHGVEIKKIAFEPLPGGLVTISLSANLACDEEKSGKLSHLIKQERKVTFEKMTQKVIDTEEELGEGEGEQPELDITPLLTKDKLDEAAGKSKH